MAGAGEADLDAFADVVRRRGLALLAVRSSARDEDDECFSFAGIHESQLGVSIDVLGEAVRRVAASSLSTRARSYREEVELPPPSGSCVVVVQELIPSESAGIVFGAGKRDRGTPLAGRKEHTIPYVPNICCARLTIACSALRRSSNGRRRRAPAERAGAIGLEGGEARCFVNLTAP